MEGVRPAQEADVPRLAELCRRALADTVAARGGALYAAREARPEPYEDSLTAALGDPDREVWAGTIDDTVVGYAVGRVEELRTGKALGVIEDIYVEPEARSVGVGEAMMNASLQWFTSRGCAGVDAAALPGDRATKNFFEESRFTARLLVMHHRLEP